MILFDLRCTRDHVFEGWFESSAAYASQRARGLVTCPICDCGAIEKAVMAPAVGAKGNSGTSDRDRKVALTRLAAMQAEMEAKSDYVGDRFAEEARLRHRQAGEGDAAPRPVYGETSMADARDLIAEGVPIAPLPFRSRRCADA